MANNPLYPGYVPNPYEDNINPLYPGYYPGQPQPRPVHQANITQTEFNFDRILGIIDGVQADYELAGPGFPRWAVDQIVTDWKQNLKVNIKSRDVKAEDLTDYDVDDLPGAFGISVTLNPMDWIEDPGKIAKETIKSWASNALEWHDLETRFREQIWKQVFDPNATTPGGDPGFKFGISEQIATGLLGMTVGAGAGGGGLDYKPVNNPLALRQRGIMIDDPETSSGRRILDGITVNLRPDGSVDYVSAAGGMVETGKTDVMSKVASSVIAFDKGEYFGPKREAAFDDIAYWSAKAVNAEMKQNPAAQSVISANPQNQAIAQAWDASVNMIDGMENAGKKFGKVQEKIEKAIQTGKDFNNNDLIELGQLRGDIDLYLGQMKGAVTGIAGGATAKDAIRLQKYTVPYTKQFDVVLDTRIMQVAKRASDVNEQFRRGLVTQSERDNLLNPIRGELNELNKKATFNELNAKKYGGLLGRPLVDEGSEFVYSIPRIAKRDLAADIYSPGHRADKTIGHIIEEAAGVDNTIASRAVRGALLYTRTSAETMSALDIMDSIEHGKFTRKYVWPRMRAYWESSTPGAYTTRFLKRVHYFGLNLADSEDDAFEKTIFFRGPKAATGAAPGRMYGNWFNINDEIKVDTGTGVARAVKIRANLYGGTQFKGVNALNTLASEVGKIDATTGNVKLTKEAFAHLLTIREDRSIPGSIRNLSDKELIKQFDKNSAFMRRFTQLNGGNAIKLPAGMATDPESLAELEKFAKNIKNFKTWVDANRTRFRVDPSIREGSPEYYMVILTALKNKNSNADYALLGITSRYVGSMQKLYYGLNTFQSTVYKKVGKYIAPIAYARNAAADAISGVIAKALAWAAVAASQGTLAEFQIAIEKVLRFVVNVTVRKSLEVAEVMFKAVTQADIDSVFKYIDKSVEKYAKILLVCCGAFVVLFLAPANDFIGMLATTFSPVDNTLTAGAGDMFGTNHQGTGIKLEPLAHDLSPNGCFDLQDYTQSVDTYFGRLQIMKWPDKWKAIIKAVGLPTGYIKRLCDPAKGGNIAVLWAQGGQPKTYCGLSFAKGGIPFTDSDTIVLGHGLCWDGFSGPIWYYNYLFAHESGHIYNFRYSWDDSVPGIPWEGTSSGGEGTLPTYAGVCSKENTQAEDYAETIGDWVQLNTYDCRVSAASADEFWNLKYPKHMRYAKDVFSRP